MLPNSAEIRVRVIAPHTTLPEGETVVSVDLAAFFRLVDAIGRNEALLLLLIRALRARTGSLALRLHDLSWMLRASRGAVTAWLDTLSEHRRVIYLAEEAWGVETVTIEIPGDHGASPYVVHHHTLPTSWFFALPLLGRASFTCFLFLLSREAHEGLVRPDDLARAAKLRSRLHAQWHLKKLHRHGILARHETTGAIVLRDVPPPSRVQRVRLRFLAHPTLGRTLRGIARLFVALALAIGIALLVLRSFPPRA